VERLEGAGRDWPKLFWERRRPPVRTENIAARLPLGRTFHRSITIGRGSIFQKCMFRLLDAPSVVANGNGKIDPL
jgi:hypothetical protein